MTSAYTNAGNRKREPDEKEISFGKKPSTADGNPQHECIRLWNEFFQIFTHVDILRKYV